MPLSSGYAASCSRRLEVRTKTRWYLNRYYWHSQYDCWYRQDRSTWRIKPGQVKSYLGHRGNDPELHIYIVATTVLPQRLYEISWRKE